MGECWSVKTHTSFLSSSGTPAVRFLQFATCPNPYHVVSLILLILAQNSEQDSGTWADLVVQEQRSHCQSSLLM